MQQNQKDELIKAAGSLGGIIILLKDIQQFLHNLVVTDGQFVYDPKTGHSDIPAKLPMPELQQSSNSQQAPVVTNKTSYMRVKEFERGLRVVFLGTIDATESKFINPEIGTIPHYMFLDGSQERYLESYSGWLFNIFCKVTEGETGTLKAISQEYTPGKSSYKWIWTPV